MGYTGDRTVTPLEPLARVAEPPELSLEPESAALPSIEITFSARPLSDIAPVVTAARTATRADTTRIFVRADGRWRELGALGATTGVITGELRAALDVVAVARAESTIANELEKLQACVVALTSRLAGTAHGDIDADAAEVVRERYEARMSGLLTRVKLVVAARSRPFRGADVHRVARALGMSKGDFGTYVFYNTTRVGAEELLVTRPADEPYRFDLSDPEATYRRIAIELALCVVPDAVWALEQQLRAAATLAQHLDGRVELATGARLDEPALREEVARALAALSAVGMLVGPAPPSDNRAVAAEQGQREEPAMEVSVGVVEPTELQLYDEETGSVHLRALIVGNRAGEYARTLGTALNTVAIGSPDAMEDEPDILYVAMPLGDIRGWATTIHFYSVPTDRMFEPMRARLDRAHRALGGLSRRARRRAQPGAAERPVQRARARGEQGAAAGWEGLPAVTYAPETVSERWMAVTGWEPVYAGAAEPDHVVPGVKLLAKVMLSRLKPA